MRYEFEGCTNPKCPDKKRHPKSRMIYVISYKMGEAPAVGEEIPCPCCGIGKTKRIFSTGLNFIVRNTEHVCHGTTEIGHGRVNGQDITVQFIDHPHTDPAYQESLRQMSREKGVTGLKHAYYSEKHGCMCVDVASNVPDPLGKLDKARRQQGLITETIATKTPVKTRPSNPAAKRPINKAGGKSAGTIPIRRG